MILRVLLVVAALMIIGCTGLMQKEELLYPNAPVVSIKKTGETVREEEYIKSTHRPTDAETVTIKYLLYRLEGREPLPYDIAVRLEDKRYGSSGESAAGVTIIRMHEGRSVRGLEVPIGELNSLTLSILPWNGLGESPYNVGDPGTLTERY